MYLANWIIFVVDYVIIWFYNLLYANQIGPINDNSISQDSLLNFYLRKYQHVNYPTTFFGRNGPCKEFYETLCAHYQIFLTIRTIVSKTGVGNLYTNNNMATIFENNNRVLCIVAGDGICPRTGYGFAQLTKWKVISIDPMMGGSKIKCVAGTNQLQSNININNFIEQKYQCILPTNLLCVRGYAEQYQYGDQYDYVILVHVHSHANFSKMWNKFSDKYKIGYTMPCCFDNKQTLDTNNKLFTKGRYGESIEKSIFYVYIDKK
jgi:hypothetical protein